MNNFVTIAAIVGFLMPPVIAFINRERWSSQIKGVVVFLACVLAAFGTAWYEQGTDWHDLRKSFIVVFGTAIATYHQFWKPTGIAPAVEHSTG